MSDLILVPTYSRHFECNLKFLESFYKYCTDREDAKIAFISTVNEEANLKELLKAYPVTVVALSHLVKAIDNVDIAEERLLENIGKFNYQSIKKLYGTYFFGSDNTIVIDSEMLCVKQFSIKDIFSTMGKNKYLFADRNIPFSVQNLVTHNCEKILEGREFKYWLFNTGYWFYEKHIMNDMFQYIKDRHHKTIIEVLTEYKPVFEAVLYNWFILKNIEKYGYNLIILNDVIRGYLGNEKFDKFQSILSESQFALEYLCAGIDKENREDILRYMNDYGIEIYSFAFGSEEDNQFCIDNSKIKMRTYYKPGL